ncbi:MAG: universal stress protein [Bacteroidia bacterium]
MKKILICIDNSAYSLKAASKGILLSKSLNAEVSLLHVIENESINKTIEVMKEEAKALLYKILEMFTCPALIYVEEGNPSEKIIETAETLKTDFIVIGTQGRTGLSIIIGSTAEEVLKHSAIPVLVVPFKAIDKVNID